MKYANLSFAPKNYLFLFPFIAFLLQQYATYCQIGLTHDSHYFLSAAKSFALSGDLLNPDSSYFSNWTPLFPVFLSPFSLKYMAVLQGICLVISLWVFMKMAFEEIQSTFFRFAFTIILCFSPYLMLVSVFLWSETLFVMLLSLHLRNLQIYVRTQSSTTFFQMIFWSFLLCLQRNTGLFFVFGTVLSILIFDKKTSKIRGSFVYGFLAVSGWIIWTIRNSILVNETAHPMLGRMFGGFGFNMAVYTESLSLFFLPANISFQVRIVLICLLISIGLLCLVLGKIKIIMLQNSFYQILLLQLFTYLILMLSIEKAIFWDVERYVAVIYPIFFLIVLVYIEKKYLQIQKPWHRKIIIIGLSLWLLYPVARTVKNVVFWKEKFCIEKSIPR